MCLLCDEISAYLSYEMSRKIFASSRRKAKAHVPDDRRDELSEVELSFSSTFNRDDDEPPPLTLFPRHLIVSS